MQLKHAIAAVFVLFSVRGMAQTDSAFTYQKPLFDFDYAKPVFKLQNEQLTNKNRFLRFSAVSGYREGVQQIVGPYNLTFSAYRDSVAWTQRITFYNTAIADIFYHFPANRHTTVLEVKDPSKYRYDPKYGDKESWMRKNAKCYEILLPLGAMTDLSVVDAFMGHEFGVTFGAAKRKINVLVLVRTSKRDQLKSVGNGDPKYSMNGHFNNISISFLSMPLIKADLPPMVNETGYTDPVDLELKISSWADLPALRKELQRYDLDLKEEIREMEVFVITEKDWKVKK